MLAFYFDTYGAFLDNKKAWAKVSFLKNILSLHSSGKLHRISNISDFRRLKGTEERMRLKDLSSKLDTSLINIVLRSDNVLDYSI